MQDCKSVKVPIPLGERLSIDEHPKSQEDMEYMAHVPYGNAFCSLMHVMVFSQLDISHAVGVLRRYMSPLRKEQWTTIKRVFI